MPRRTWLKGTVDWFDKLSGEGFIRSEDGRWFYVHYSSIKSKQKRKQLKQSQKVKFTVQEELGNDRIFEVKAA